MLSLKCSFCLSQNIVKNGVRKGKQRWLCKNCNKSQIEDSKYSILQKKSVIKSYIFGEKIREIARAENIPFQVVSYWVSSIKKKIKDTLPRNLEDLTRSQCKNVIADDKLFLHSKKNDKKQ